MCGIVLLLHLLAGELVCWVDTSSCTVGREKRIVYQGVLKDDLGQPRVDTPFTIAFPSREGRSRVGGLQTDAHGGYCVVWAYERVRPMIYADAGDDGTVPPPVLIETLDKPGAPPPAGCTVPEADVPWKRSDDLTRTWQYRSLPVVTIAAALLLVVGLLRGRGWRPGIALAGVPSALWAVLWLI